MKGRMSMSSSRWSLRTVPNVLAALTLLFTGGASLMASPAVAASATDDAADCSPVAIDESEWEDYGLVGRRSYESPQFGITAEWDRTWAVDEEAQYPIESNEDCQYDVIRLIWEDGDLYGLLVLNFGMPEDVEAMDELVDGWSSKTFLRDNWADGFTGEVAVADADDTTAEAVFSVVRDEDDAQFFVTYRTVALSKDTWLYVTFTTDEASFADAWAALDEGVQVDGEPVPAVLTWRQIDRAI